jgi:phosphoglycolate phosphatase-like HAD superfamily hydrolase
MIGDILNDVEAGNRAGCQTIHIDNGNETKWVRGDYRQPLYTVKDLAEAAGIICHEASTSTSTRTSACAVRPEAVHC